MTNAHPGHVAETLPENTVARLRETLGDDLSRLFLAAFGGTEVYIPLRPNGDDRISRVIGLSGTVALTHAIGHGKLVVPMADNATRIVNRAEAQRMAEEGASARQVARALNIHLRTAQRYMAVRP